MVDADVLKGDGDQIEVLLPVAQGKLPETPSEKTEFKRSILEMEEDPVFSGWESSALRKGQTWGWCLYFETA